MLVAKVLSCKRARLINAARSIKLGANYLGVIAAFAVPMLADMAQAQDAKKIEAKMMCGAHTANPDRLRAFQVNLTFEVAQGVLSARRETRESPGSEIFRGYISPSGEVLLGGDGKRESGSAAWVYEFRGNLNPSGLSVIKGKLRSTVGPVGVRACSMSFDSRRPSDI